METQDLVFILIALLLAIVVFYLFMWLLPVIVILLITFLVMADTRLLC